MHRAVGSIRHKGLLFFFRKASNVTSHGQHSLMHFLLYLGSMVKAHVRLRLLVTGQPPFSFFSLFFFFLA